MNLPGQSTAPVLITLTENLKLQLSPGLVASYDIQPGNPQKSGFCWQLQGNLGWHVIYVFFRFLCFSFAALDAK